MSKLKPDELRRKLKKQLELQQFIRAIEVHNGLSTLVANNTKIELEVNGKVTVLEFDAMWASGFTDSASKGLPDCEIVGLDSRVNTIDQIISNSSKPVIVDGDTGGEIFNFEYLINKLERLGVSAVIIEDKTFPKRNSLDDRAVQHLADPMFFAEKIAAGKAACYSNDFLIFARIESLIAGYDIEDALSRAKCYLKAGADGIVIHSRDNVPTRVLKFAEEYSKLTEKIGIFKPLVCIPTTYNSVKESELRDKGFQVVIYANHLLRASIKSMQEVCKTILNKGRAFETEPFCTPVSKVLSMVGFTEITEKDQKRLAEQSKAKAIILAAGKPKEYIFENTPPALLNINGKTVIERQLDTLKRCDINKISVIRGYEKSKFSITGVTFSDVDDFEKGSLNSLITSGEPLTEGFVILFSDILFDVSIISALLKTKEDIVLVADASYPFHRHEIDKELDLIIGKQNGSHYREPSMSMEKEISFIGKKIKKEIATHEFIGLAKFSKYGAQSLLDVYSDCLSNHQGKFHESGSFVTASIVDMLQEMIDRGFKVHYVETNKGWMEIHNKRDYEISKKMIY